MIQPIFRNDAQKIRRAEKRARDLRIKRHKRGFKRGHSAAAEIVPFHADRPSVSVIQETRRIAWIRNVGLTVDPHHTPPRGMPPTEAQRITAAALAQRSMDQWFAANPRAWTD